MWSCVGPSEQRSQSALSARAKTFDPKLGRQIELDRETGHREKAEGDKERQRERETDRQI